MNTKSFFASGIVAFIINFLLGWVFYGMLFTDLYPNQGNENMLFIALGCLFSGFVIAYILTSVASVKSMGAGFKIGAVFALLYGLSMNFFMYANMEPNYQNMAIDVVIGIVMFGIMGAAVAMVNDKLAD